jgi:hypothetical protein
MLAKPGEATLPPLEVPDSLLKLLFGEVRTPDLDECLPGEVGRDPRGEAMRVLGALVISSGRLPSSSSLRPEIRRRARGRKVLSETGVDDVLEEEALAGWRFMASSACVYLAERLE